ncbi:hypothetical protein M426DRAFT_94156 [Hypoxylon sp. CI-4A]|nr:hypothetical protein M426DRAFT_94156 [Hypoxylon sp. CI-4A]
MRILARRGKKKKMTSSRIQKLEQICGKDSTIISFPPCCGRTGIGSFTSRFPKATYGQDPKMGFLISFPTPSTFGCFPSVPVLFWGDPN